MTDRPSCPYCGKKLRVTQRQYEYEKKYSGDANKKFTGYGARKQVSAKPAFNAHAPFCTLTCGWMYGKTCHEQALKK